MANTFLHDEAGVSSSISELKSALDSYKNNISTLEGYISEMNGSSAWQDEIVKTSFIAAAQGYITAYKTFTSGIEGYIECLSKKSKNLADHESNFSK